MSLVRTFLAVLLPTLLLAVLLGPTVVGAATRPTRQLLESSARRVSGASATVRNQDVSSHQLAVTGRRAA
ncbi:hypothetical protein [Hymenobacter perfusus]|uniref:Uncharacterized protein n=1 Tax=Hymenobacter perfusus TaxID=1236770 RepID=A0A428K8I8_9BACT|nr:hypothetical protein [Hymenobacter perfusus]RSK42687.1 hypothetical protein EI293_12870 [Hymenobacter perfusus]